MNGVSYLAPWWLTAVATWLALRTPKVPPSFSRAATPKEARRSIFVGGACKYLGLETLLMDKVPGLGPGHLWGVSSFSFSQLSHSLWQQPEKLPMKKQPPN